MRAANKFYDKNLTTTMNHFKNHLQHTARLFEIKNSWRDRNSSIPQLTRTLSSTSRTSNTSRTGGATTFDEHTYIVKEHNKATQSRIRVVNKYINKQNEDIFHRLQEIHNVRTKFDKDLNLEKI